MIHAKQRYMKELKWRFTLLFFSIFWFSFQSNSQVSNYEIRKLGPKLDSLILNNMRYIRDSYILLYSTIKPWQYKLKFSNQKMYLRFDTITTQIILSDSVIIGGENEGHIIYLNKFEVNGIKLTPIDTTFGFTEKGHNFWLMVYDSDGNDLIETSRVSTIGGNYKYRFISHKYPRKIEEYNYYCNGILASKGYSIEGKGKTGIWKYYTPDGKLWMTGKHKFTGAMKLYQDYNFQHFNDTSCSIDYMQKPAQPNQQYFYRYGIWREFKDGKLLHITWFIKDNKIIKLF